MSAQATNHQIEVLVNGIDTSRPGKILVMLFAEPGFPKVHDKALQINRYDSDRSEFSVVFDNAPAQFAIKVLHDEDEDGKVSKNWTGLIPKEGLGFSNGAKITFKAPSFSSARLDAVDTPFPHEITILYP